MRRAVKSPRVSLVGVLLGLLGAAGLGLSPPARAQLLFGGTGPAPPRPPPPLDARIPTGPEASFEPRPAPTTEPPACSFRLPVCVHRAAGAPPDRALAWLSALEDAYERLVFMLALPPPLPDGTAGGGPALDLYLGVGASEMHVHPDRPELGRLTDAATAFCAAGQGETDVARAATLCVGEAIALRLDASETPFTRRALAAELWLVTGTPSSEDARRIDDFQAHPELSIAAREGSPQAEGAALFGEFLDQARGRAAPASLAVATYALSARGVSAGGARYTNEPDTMDVLRNTFGPKPSDVARLFGDFAVARAFLGSRDGDGVWPALSWLGDFGRVRFEWSVPWSSLPRNLAPSRPIEPTGSTYLWLSFDRDPGNSVLAFRADWEPPVGFKWELAVVGDFGRTLRRVDVPYLERETQVERTVGDLAGARGVLIAGTNLGGLGPSYPFDPDFEPFEPHAYNVYLAVQ